MPKNRTDLPSLEKSLKRSRQLVAACAILTVSIYLSWFWGFQSNVLADQSGPWGQFGDYIGGILNPLVAYAAFYWLTRSVQLQKEELQETRQALQEATSSQSQQAQYSRTSVRVAALSALINSLMVEVQTQRMQLQFILDQRSQHHAAAAPLLDGRMYSGEELQGRIDDINAQIVERMTTRSQYEEEIIKPLEKLS